jgi:hypothetical protein
VAFVTEEMISEDDHAQTQTMARRIVLIKSQDMKTAVVIEATEVEIVVETDSTNAHDETSNYLKQLVLLVATLVRYLSVQTAQSQYCVRNVSLRRTLHR